MASDPIFSDPRLAAIYDDVDGDRDDLDVYEAIVEEFGARSVLDIGCGTGVLAVRLAARGVDVVGVDPAAASLAIARTRTPEVTWIDGDVTALPPLQVDLATMTANVAQVFLTDEEWEIVLTGALAVLRPGGHLVFETRVPEFRAWDEWAVAPTRVVDTRSGPVECSTDVTHVTLPFVSFRHTYRFDDGSVITSDSTLRFRSRAEVEHDLASAGFDVVDVRDAPDRPGREFVFVARAAGQQASVPGE